MILYIRYNAPVIAEVDLDAGQVTRVVVEDDNLTQDRMSEGLVVTLPDMVTTAADKDAERAEQIADADAWPAWEFGW